MDLQQMTQPQGGMMGGGLPALSAQHAQSQGRGGDTMLVHMTPNEVNSLQGLAMAHGGSLTINPQTGLPEAGFLSKILPLLLGIGLNFAIPGLGLAIKGISTAAQAGLMVGAGTTAITGNLQKGLMAGLSAFGGASLAGGVQGALGGAAKTAATAAPAPVATEVAKTVATEAVPTAVANVAPGLNAAAEAANMASLGGQAVANVAPGFNAAAEAANMASLGGQAVAKTGFPGFMQGFADTARGSATGLLGKAAVPMAISGVYGGLSGAMTPSNKSGMGGEGAVDNSYQGSYYNEPRKVIAMPKAAELIDPVSSGERTFFDRSVPGVFNRQGQQVLPGANTAPGTMLMTPMLNPNAKKGQPMYSFAPQSYMGGADPSRGMSAPNQGMLNPEEDTTYAHGGPVHMSAGSFVMPARETAEFGKGSTNAGQRVLSGLGGIPIRGKGDGTSDDIRASIGGQEARVADGEVHFPPEAVRRIGKGSEKRGTDKLYAMMKRAEQSRKQAARGGGGLNVAKGLRAA
jgi:hypothetical protein